jgi:hypothetical protein
VDVTVEQPSDAATIMNGTRDILVASCHERRLRAMARRMPDGTLVAALLYGKLVVPIAPCLWV